MTDHLAGGHDGSGANGLLGVSQWEAEVVRLGVTGAMDVLSRGIAEVVRAAPAVPSRTCVRFGCASIEVEWPVTAVPTPTPASTEPLAEPEGHVVLAPLVGTFHRAPAPGAKPFVEVGDLVEPGQQVGVMEAMKVLSPVTSDVGGRVRDILTADAEAVEFGQPLLVLEPGTRG